MYLPQLASWWFTTLSLPSVNGRVNHRLSLFGDVCPWSRARPPETDMWAQFRVCCSVYFYSAKWHESQMKMLTWMGNQWCSASMQTWFIALMVLFLQSSSIWRSCLCTGISLHVLQCMNWCLVCKELFQFATLKQHRRSLDSNIKWMRVIMAILWVNIQL